jgi:hypothetical protein
MITNANITVYNAYEINGVDAYTRCVITGAYWFSRTKVNVDEGLSESSETIVRIPLTASFEKIYCEPLFFIKADDKTRYVTFKSGDIVVKGIAEIANPTKSFLKKTYEHVFTITSVTDNRIGSKGMQHFKIEGV